MFVRISVSAPQLKRDPLGSKHPSTCGTCKHPRAFRCFSYRSQLARKRILAAVARRKLNAAQLILRTPRLRNSVSSWTVRLRPRFDESISRFSRLANCLFSGWIQ